MSKQRNKSYFYNIRLAGFNLSFTASVRDPSTCDLILLDLIGPLQSVRASWASLKSRKQSNWNLGGPTKMNKEPGHHILKTQLPCGAHNWTIISRQAIPKLIRQDFPTYFWYEKGEFVSDDIPPKMFMPIFETTAPFPVKPNWTDYLWKIGFERRQIVRLADCNGVTGYKLRMDSKTWAEGVEVGIRASQII